MDTASFLAVFIILFGFPAWIPIICKETTSAMFKWALGLVTTSQVVQLAFVISVGLGWILLDYSQAFGAISVPFCLVGMALGAASFFLNGSGAGVVGTGILTLLMWLFLVTLH